MRNVSNLIILINYQYRILCCGKLIIFCVSWFLYSCQVLYIISSTQECLSYNITIYITRSWSNPPEVDLIKPDLMSSRKSVRKNFLRFGSDSVCERDRRMVPDDMTFDPIQGQGQGHRPLDFEISAIFKGYILTIYRAS